MSLSNRRVRQCVREASPDQVACHARERQEWLEYEFPQACMMVPSVVSAMRDQVLCGWQQRGTLYSRVCKRATVWKHRCLSLPLVRHLRGLMLRRTSALYPGRAIDTQVVRYYWSRFLSERRSDIRGRVLEIGTTDTVRYVGGKNVEVAEAIDIVASSSSVTIVADLADAGHVPSDQFDCFVNQFTIHLLYDFKAALYHSIRLLKPGGVLLINFPCRSGYPADGIPLGGERKAHVYWWFTPRLVETVLSELGITGSHCQLKTYGNLFALTAYMAGIPSEELTVHELEAQDPDIPLLICARVQKPHDWSPRYRPAA